MAKRDIERRIFIIWYERFNTVNQGIIRLLCVILGLNGLLAIAYIGAIVVDLDSIYDLLPFFLILIFPIIHVLIILLFRLLICLYDGFTGKAWF